MSTSANRTYHEHCFPATSIYQRKSISLYSELLSLEIRGHTVQHDLRLMKITASSWHNYTFWYLRPHF